MSLGLLPSLLSHARRTLTKVLRLDTDYTTARATNLDNIETSNFTTRVQAGLTAQGYTTTRAGYLDNIEASAFTTRVQAGMTAQGYTTTRAGYLDNIETSNFTTRVQAGLTAQGYTTARAGYLDNIEASNFTTRVQAGLNANGYTTTVSARIDTSVSTRRQRMRQQPSIANSSATATMLSLGGSGVLTAIVRDQGGPGSGGTLSVVIDGVTVFSGSAPGGAGDDDVLLPEGRIITVDSGTSNPAIGTYLGWEWTSSVSVSVNSSNNGTWHIGYKTGV